MPAPNPSDTFPAGPALRLRWLEANQAFAFTFGDALLRLEGAELFFPDRPEAVRAAEWRGLKIRQGGFLELA